LFICAGGSEFRSIQVLEPMPGCVHPTIASGATPIGSAGRAPDGKITSRKSTKKFFKEESDEKKREILRVHSVVNTREKKGQKIFESKEMGKIFEFGGKYQRKKEMGKSSGPLSVVNTRNMDSSFIPIGST